MRKIIGGLLFGIFLINFISATIICSPDSISVSYNVGETPPSQTISCTNEDVNNSVTLNKLGQYFSTNPLTPITINPGEANKQITINFDSAPEGVYNNYLYFSDGSNPIPITITSSQQSTGCRLIELPHTTTYRIKQGETGISGQIKLKVSTECQNTMVGMTVTEQTQMSKPMFLQGASGDVEPGEIFSFSIGLDAEGVSTGNYQNTYIVSGSIGDTIYQKSINLNTIVTVGTSPVDSETFSNLPSCTIDSDMSLNQTYSLICNKENPLIDVGVPYNEFFKGVDVIESEGKVEYKIQPLKVGVTNFLALFTYKGLQIGEPFIKEIRIMQGSVPVQGTELEPLFYQMGIKKEVSNLLNGDVTVLVRDSNTKTIVPSFTIYLNGEQVNNTFSIESERKYEMIISSPGYLSNTLNFSVLKSQLQIIDPPQSTYSVGDTVNLSTQINGSSFTLDDVVINSPYTFTSSGTFTLKAFKEGYLPVNKTIQVMGGVSYTSMSPDYDDWKKGKQVTIQLTKNASWNVEFEEFYDKDEMGNNLYKEKIILASGQGTMVDFKLEKKGIYTIKAEGEVILSKEISDSTWYNPLSWEWVNNLGYWWILIIIGLGFGYWFIFSKGTSRKKGEDLVKFSPPGG